MACSRCGAPLQFREPPRNPDARLLRRSAVPVGHCAACAVTHWLRHSFYAENIAAVIARQGPEILLDRRVVDQMAKVLQAGCADAKPQEIDWVAVVVNWDLSFPCQPGCDNRPRPGPAGPPPSGQATLF